ncbi:DUF1648 domain-containing protein [Amycolatopsis australiensis]|uniref:DUF1648 domain-containing protein n=1 Tax=Amycolatopsis australiensis TaxID=546364 RepID=A0A1K1S4E8_9PSEU|nr:DUF1648 domain-containing protein [Amycolatopsis australiensis]SFW79312.1 hypothetical protein SAMN04489730_4708 [Amycolatopsis australiensis]
MKPAVLRYGVPAVIMLGVVVPALVLAPRLPDPIAVHWGWGGVPNAHAPWWLVTGGAAVFWGAAWIAVARSVSAASGVYALGGILLAAHSVGLWANVDVTSWDHARPVGWLLALGILAVGLVAGAAGWVLAPPRPADAERGAAPSFGLGADEQAVWSGTAHNLAMVVAAPVAAAAAAVLGSADVWRIGLLVSVVALVFSTVRVLVGPSGVRVRVGLLGWPRRTLAYDEIAEARADRIVPLAYGGWGWRRRPGRSAIVVRAGEGLVLHLRSGGRFVVTVDAAETAAGLVNDYVSRHRSPAS